MKTLIKNIDIITMNDVKPVIRDGFIGLKDDRIAFVGETEQKDFVADEIIDGRHKLAMPGLVNAHTHSPMTLFRSYADDMHLEKWLFDYIFPAEAKLNGEDAYWGSMLGITEMLRFGTTCFADMYFFMEDVAKATLDTGVRACLSRGCQKFDEDDANAQVRLKENVDLYNNYHKKGDGLITVFIGPHAVYTCTPEYLKECYDAAKDLNIGLHIHLSETRIEVKNCLEKYGTTPIEHCYKLGILDDTVLAAHCVHPTEREIDILKESGVNVAHNPGSNLKLASGIAPVPKYLNEGINVCLGTDGASSNNNLNMFEEISLAALINKGANYDATLVSAYDSLKMATVKGAKALGFNDVGKIEKGYKADLILLDIDKPHFYPKHDLIANVVYSAQGSDVDTVLVNGKVLYKSGQYTTIDFEKIKHNLDRICKNIF